MEAFIQTAHSRYIQGPHPCECAVDAVHCGNGCSHSEAAGAQLLPAGTDPPSAAPCSTDGINLAVWLTALVCVLTNQADQCLLHLDPLSGFN